MTEWRTEAMPDEAKVDVPAALPGVTLAQARMWAWDRLDGWGNTTDGKFSKMNMQDRKESAGHLAAWVLGGRGNESCSFCEKHKSKVKTLIAGPHAYICDECVHVSLDVLNGLIEKSDDKDGL